MKIIKISSLLLSAVFVSSSNNSSGNNFYSANNVLTLQNEAQIDLAKDYFVCKCIAFSLQKSGVKYNDGSSFSYLEFLNEYSFEDIDKISICAKDFVNNNFNKGMYEDKNFMIKRCLDHRKSAGLEKFIKSLGEKDKK